MRKAARTLSVSLVLTALLGACQAVPTGTDGSFQTQGKRHSPSPSAPQRPAPSKSRPKPAPSKPTPSKPAPISERPSPDSHKRHPDHPRPQPTVAPTPYRGYPGDWNGDDRYDRQRSAVQITRVWTDGVASDHLTVHWTTDRPTIGMVEWGTTDFRDRSDWEMTADTYHSVDVRDLEPDTEYRFRVLARQAGGAGVWSPELRTRTEP